MPGVALAQPARQLVEAQALDLLRRHEQKIVAVRVRFRDLQHQGMLNGVEDPGEAGGKADLRIARRQAQQDAAIEAHAGDGVARAEPQQAAIFGARRGDVGEIGAADELADHFGRLD